VGNYCSIADDVHILHTGNGRRLGRGTDGNVVPLPSLDGHRASSVTTFPLRLLTREPDLLPPGTEVLGSTLRIGNDVWIGSRATVSGPVTVGDGAIIGTGAVVISDVPPYAVVAGNPARVVRMRFSPAMAQALQRTAWWNWPEDVIAARWEELYGDLREFVRRYDPEAEAAPAGQQGDPDR
jgi:acetyltransferase-like isoleucine patch superfamily enzyme